MTPIIRRTVASMFPLLIFLIISSNEAIQLKMDSDMTKNLANYIIESDLQHSTIFGEDTMFLITDDSFEAFSVVDTLTDTLQIPVVILRKGFSTLNLEKLRPCLTFIIVRKKEDIEDLLEELLSSNSFKVYTPAGFILCDQIEQEEERQIPDLLRKIWKYGLRRYIVFYTSDKFHVKKYNPFLKEIFEVQPIKSQVFDDHINNLHGYKFKVSLFEEWPLLKKDVNALTNKQKWVGRDIVLLDIIMRILNATYEVVEPPENTRYEGAVQDLINNKVDFCFVRHFQAYLFDGIEYSEFSDISHLTLLVPRPRKLTRTEAMFTLVSLKLWIAILASFLGLGVFIKFFVSVKRRFHWTPSDISLDIWGMLLGTAIHRFPIYGNGLRISIFFWLWCALVLSVVFQGHLINLIQFVKHDKGIRSLEELEDSKIPVYTPYNLSNLTGNPNILEGQIVHINYTDLQRILWHDKPNAAFVVSFAKIRGYLNPNVFPKNGSVSHRLMPSSLGYSFAVYLFKKHSPFSRSIARRILMMREFGYSTKNTDTKSIFNDDDRVHKKLDLEQVEGAFFILINGIICCLVVLLGEIILFTLKKNQ